MEPCPLCFGAIGMGIGGHFRYGASRRLGRGCGALPRATPYPFQADAWPKGGEGLEAGSDCPGMLASNWRRIRTVRRALERGSRLPRRGHGRAASARGGILA
jgi:hypothetical protein